jgi:hypothetical protein
VIAKLLADLQASGLRDIAGSRVSARVPVSRALLNRFAAQALAGTAAPVRDVDIRPRTGDQIDVVVTLTWRFVPALKVAVAIVQQPQFPSSPVLVLRWSLLGAVGALVSRVMTSLDALPAGARLEGDRLLLDIPTLAARTPAASALPYVRVLELHTLDDRLVIDAELEVPERSLEGTS